MTVVSKKKKNTEHTRMYIFFLEFLHHYSQQRSAVRSTAPHKYEHTTKNSDMALSITIVLLCSAFNEYQNFTNKEHNEKKYGAHSHVHLLYLLYSPLFTAEVSGT